MAEFMKGNKLNVDYAGQQIQAGGSGCGCGGSGRVLNGGGKPTAVAAKTARALVGNRVLDLYLKYLGVTTLTSATLVPFALVLGRDAFEAVVNEMARQKKGQRGGVHIPVVDDKLFGTYLKLAGLTVLEFTPTTLIPLGVLMAAYHYWSKKTGKQFGGASTAFNTNPENSFQRTMRVLLDGDNQANSLIAGSARVGDYQSQVALAGQQSGGGSAWMASQYSRGAVNSPGQNEQDFREFTQGGDYKSNYDLSNGSAAGWAKDWQGWHFSNNQQGYPGGYKTLVDENPATSPPTGYDSGNPTRPFSGGSRQFHMSGGKLIERLSEAIEKFHSSFKQKGGSTQVANEVALNSLMGSELVQADYRPEYGVQALPYQSGGRKRRSHRKRRHSRR